MFRELFISIIIRVEHLKLSQLVCRSAFFWEFSSMQIQIEQSQICSGEMSGEVNGSIGTNNHAKMINDHYSRFVGHKQQYIGKTDSHNTWHEARHTRPCVTQMLMRIYRFSSNIYCYCFDIKTHIFLWKLPIIFVFFKFPMFVLTVFVLFFPYVPLLHTATPTHTKK